MNGEHKRKRRQKIAKGLTTLGNRAIVLTPFFRYRSRNFSLTPFDSHNYSINVLGSVMTPVTAAAAATRGEARMVREPGP